MEVALMLLGSFIVLIAILISEEKLLILGMALAIVGLVLGLVLGSINSKEIKEHKILETNTYENIVFDKVVRIEYDVLENGNKINEKIFTE